MLVGSQFESNLCYWFESILGPVCEFGYKHYWQQFFNRSTIDLSLDVVVKNSVEIIVPF